MNPIDSSEKPLDLKAEEFQGTEREYDIKCEVRVFRHSYKEIADSRQHETKSVALIPDIETTEAMMFLNAWLPSTFKVCLDCESSNLKANDVKCPKCGSKNIKMEWTECAAFISYPVGSPCRCAVLRKNDYVDKHHLFVMSSGVEDELLNLNGRYVYVKIFEGTKDYMADSAPTINRTVKGN